MAAWVYPSIPLDELKSEEEESLVSRLEERSLPPFQWTDNSFYRRESSNGS